MSTDANQDKRFHKLSPSEFYALQEYVSYTGKKLSDVLVEFEGGVLAQYNAEEPIDYEGFKLFMRAYFDTDLPDQLSQGLFLAFVKGSKDGNGGNPGVQAPDPWVRRHSIPLPKSKDSTKAVTEALLTSGTIMIKDLACYISLLEAGTVEEKLEFTFKLYDSDDNGVLDREEVDHIINQMMTVAKYLGWDVSELHPILTEMMHELDYDSDGMVTFDEWKRGGLTNIPLLVLLGLDKNVQDDGSHVWRLKHFGSKRAYCNHCQNLLVGFGKQGFSCKFCKYTVHERCAAKAPASCISTYTKTRKTTLPMQHHWVNGNCLHKCDKCRKSIKSGLEGKHCRWCQLNLHDKCSQSQSAICELGELKEHILPPTCISPSVLDRQGRLSRQNSTASMAAASSSLQIQPPVGTTPLVVFINPKSGGKQGSRLLRKLQYLLNPRQVFNMVQDGGPIHGLKQFQDVDCRVMVAGGDGTVGWLLEGMDKMGLIKRPPVVVLPLGTGNDLARCLRWGGGYGGESLIKIMKRIGHGHTVMLDRWQIEFSGDHDSTEKGDPVPCNIVNNYFSIGVDAQVAHKFHAMREKHPEKFSSRMRNKLWYFEFCATETFTASCKNLHENIDVMCDGVALDMANGPRLEGICLLNIPSAHAGSNLWGDNAHPKRKNRYRDSQHSINGLAGNDLTSAVQDMGDNLIEVIGVENCIHMGAVKTGLRSNCRRLAQCSNVVIRSRKRLPMQIDGEPWMQPPCTVSVTHKNQVPMVMGPEPKSTSISCFKAG